MTNLTTIYRSESRLFESFFCGFNASFIKSIKLCVLLTTAAVLTACGSTSNQVQVAPKLESNVPALGIIDQGCYSQAQDMAASAQTSGGAAQNLSAARYMLSCLPQPMPVSLSQRQSQAVMQLMANVTLNFIQGGDIAAAKDQMRIFEQQFPNQDLYLADFTSFQDTANALLNSSFMSSNQLASLNISRALRDELERQNYWLSN